MKKCINCGKEFNEDVLTCSECGGETKEVIFEENEQEDNSNSNDNIVNEKIVKEPMSDEKKDKIKKYGMIITALVIIAVCFNSFISPMMNYSKANDLIQEKKYAEAIETFEKLEDYKDSKKQLEKVRYEYGVHLVNEKKYEQAVENLEKSIGEDKESYLNYAKGISALENGKYTESVECLKELVNFKDSDKKLKEAYYGAGTNLLSSGNAALAKENFLNAGDYKDASAQILVCDLAVAENKFKDGELNEAQKLYANIPDNVEYKGITAGSRKQLLNNYKNIINLSGTWYGNDGYFESRETWKYDGSWENWYNSYDSTVDISVTINDDESITIKGSIPFYIYTNYSSLSYALDQKLVRAHINLTLPKGQTSVSKLVDNSIVHRAQNGTPGYVNVTYTGDSIKLDYKLNDEYYSTNFKETYVSRITLRKK